MSGDKGGDVSADPMLEYANKALDLQKSIYNDDKSRNQPYYQAGASGLNELMMRLGLTGSSSFQPRDRKQLEKELYDSNKYLNQTGDWATTVTDFDALNAEADRIMGEEQSRIDSAKGNPEYGSLMDTFSLDDFEEEPGYQFRLDQGEKGLERKLAASGKYFNPEAAQAMTEYNQDFASNEFMNSYNRDTNDKTNIFNRLLGITGLGQTASQQLSNAGTNYANSATDLYTGMGNAVTAANAANASRKGSMFNNILGMGASIGGAYLGNPGLSWI